MSELRTPAAAVEPLFVSRWSRRAFSQQDVSARDLASCFEAARWAASCYNDQPWRYHYARRGTPTFTKVAEVLVEGNRIWAAEAPVLGVVFTRRDLRKTGKPNAWARFDAGAASAQFALQASLLGLSVHYMAGFDPEQAYAALQVSAEEYDAVAAFAIGHPGDATSLPDSLAEREVPSDRFPVADFAVEIQ